MIQWDYQITIHEIPEPKAEKQNQTFECDQTGRCFVHDAFRGGMEWLEDLFREKGMKGWELVQSEYHHRELFCIWKKRKETERKG